MKVEGRVVAIIPAKGHSRRVPNKNMRFFNGRPLVAWTIEQALKSRLVDEVYVSTDSPEIQACAISCGAQAPFLRPAELARDEVHGVLAIIDMLQRLGGEGRYAFCVQLLPTSPLRNARTIDGVVRLSQERHANVLSVTRTGKILGHLRTMEPDGRLISVADKVVYNLQTQDQPELLALNGAAYCAPSAELLCHRTFQYGSPLGYVMDPLEAYDIDTEEDWLIAECLAAQATSGLARDHARVTAEP